MNDLKNCFGGSGLSCAIAAANVLPIGKIAKAAGVAGRLAFVANHADEGLALVTRNRAVGLAVEQAVRESIGGSKANFSVLVNGRYVGRHVDVLAGGIIHEVKVGFVTSLHGSWPRLRRTPASWQRKRQGLPCGFSLEVRQRDWWEPQGP